MFHRSLRCSVGFVQFEGTTAVWRAAVPQKLATGREKRKFAPHVTQLNGAGARYS